MGVGPVDGETRVESHYISIQHESAPEARSEQGYLYKFGIQHGDEDYHPIAVPVEKRKWAGNFWRKKGDRAPEPDEVPMCVWNELPPLIPGARTVKELRPYLEDADARDSGGSS
jgi:hypothetical protein